MEQVKNNKPKISVIIPIYNGEKYLAECIDSILNQTFNDFELLLILDGSKDKSEDIAKSYAEKDYRVRVVSKENEGINATRKRGVKEAMGEWVAFCDQDDSYIPTALEKLYSLSSDTDIVIGFPEKPNHRKVLSLEECRHDMVISRLLPCSPWAKLFRKDMLSDDIFNFPRAIDGEEDMIMNIRILFKTNKAPHILFEKIYNFRRNNASVSHTKKASLEHENLFDIIRTGSIPAAAVGEYMKEIIWSRINGLTSIAYNNPEVIALWEHEYLKRLYKDIKQYNYKRNLREYIITEIRNRHAIKLTAFIRLACCSLSYRLKLNN